MSKVLVIIPTYNEKENIQAIIQAVLSQEHNYHILVVDDGSPDGTAAIVKNLQTTTYKNELHLLEREGKLGLGTAYIAGFRYGLEKGYEVLMEMDADFSHNPQDLPRLVAALSDTQTGMAVGSRYVKGGGFRNWDKYRLMLSFGASIYTRLITGMPVKDPTAGFVAYKRETLEKMDLNKIQFIGYAFQIEMKYYCYKLGYKIQEVPITFIDRELGVSKMNMSIVQEGILGVLKMRMRQYT